MDLSKLQKPLRLPQGFVAPALLRHGHLKAMPLNRKDVQEDLTIVNSNQEIILRTRGGTWPDGELTFEFNALDFAWHEREARDCTSFAYTVRNNGGEYVGCFYLYPLGQRQVLTEELLEYDVDASWWVTERAYKRGDYEFLYEALRSWLNAEFQVAGRPWFSNIEIPKLEPRSD